MPPIGLVHASACAPTTPSPGCTGHMPPRMRRHSVSTTSRVPPRRHVASQPSRLGMQLYTRAIGLHQDWFRYASMYLRQLSSTDYLTMHLRAHATNNHCLGNSSTPWRPAVTIPISPSQLDRTSPPRHTTDWERARHRSPPRTSLGSMGKDLIVRRGVPYAASISHVVGQIDAFRLNYRHHALLLLLPLCRLAGEEEWLDDLDASVPWSLSSAHVRTTTIAATPGRGNLRVAPPPHVRANEARGSGSVPSEDEGDAASTTIFHGEDKAGNRVYATTTSDHHGSPLPLMLVSPSPCPPRLLPHAFVCVCACTRAGARQG